MQLEPDKPNPSPYHHRLQIGSYCAAHDAARTGCRCVIVL